MDVVKEKGILYGVSTIRGYGDLDGFWIPIGLRPFYYNKVIWIDTLKFAIGNWDKESKRIGAMVEFSTKATAVSSAEINGTPTIDKLVAKYKEKLARHEARCGEQVVEDYNSKYTIQLWQTNLWAL